MAKKTAPLLPATDALLQQFGERLRLARRRRNLSATQVCERAGMAPMTLRSVERGGSGVTIGAYLAVMQVLGIEQDLTLLAEADTIGRSLQDARLPLPRSAKLRGKTIKEQTGKPTFPAEPEFALHAGSGNAPGTGYAEMLRLSGGGTAAYPLHKTKKFSAVEEGHADWPDDGMFVSSSMLADLITPAKKDK